MQRRYDIDWLRVIAIGLLLVYHVAIGFQPWGVMIGFITNGESWSSLWLPMTMLNIWRIPFLFFVSGMGVYFSMQRRSWKELMVERSLRILVPYIFGMVCIFPISVIILQAYYHWDLHYAANAGHLWFLGNIFVYAVLLTPLFYSLQKNLNGKFVTGLKKMLSSPLGLTPVVILFVGEVLVIKPMPYELYAMTWHGFVLGLLAFVCGFCFSLCGESFWHMLRAWRWLFLVLALVLFVVRIFVFGFKTPGFLLAVESNVWIFSVLAFGSKNLNRSSKALSYLSEAAYPVYILHMIFLFLGSWLIFPLTWVAPLKFVVVLVFTFAGCFGTFEIIRRVVFLRPLFGLKIKARQPIIHKNNQGLAQA
ncbi:acyltransferase family protein [Chryseolinea lacunae]|uniref:acyltransferase family protein n=1 Tax=Chryseolinea lacunae TaxID=2801331 RepID=UPI001EFFFEA5|nr:acyltransferase family protein [Chryseolinea lacunae]